MTLITCSRLEPRVYHTTLSCQLTPVIYVDCDIWTTFIYTGQMRAYTHSLKSQYYRLRLTRVIVARTSSSPRSQMLNDVYQEQVKIMHLAIDGVRWEQDVSQTVSIVGSLCIFILITFYSVNQGIGKIFCFTELNIIIVSLSETLPCNFGCVLGHSGEQVRLLCTCKCSYRSSTVVHVCATIKNTSRT